MTDQTQADDNMTIKPNVGLDDDVLAKTIDVLQTLLADETVLYMKTRNYHWNVTGPHFTVYHELFEKQYDALAPIIDEIAERIRVYGGWPIGTLKEVLGCARLQEETPGEVPSAQQMITNLFNDHEAMARALREAIDATDDIDNDGAEDFLTQLLQTHQETAWMLRAHIEGA
jgi:starvation-inducible DNA-binding protein